MQFMKKFAVLTALALLLSVLCACSYVGIEDGSEVEARFISGANSVETRLSDEDAAAVNAMFEGKALYGETLPCTFTRDFSLIIDGSAYCLADDGCPFIYIDETGKYFLLTSDEHKELKGILGRYGVSFTSEEQSQGEVKK